MGPDQAWELPQAEGSDGGEPPRAETFRKMCLSGGSEGMGLEVGRPVRDRDGSPGRAICVCGLVGTLGAVRRKDVGFPGAGDNPSCRES